MSKTEQLTLSGTVELAKGGTGNNFKIKAYTGQAVERSLGRMCIDVCGIVAKQRLPVLLGHDHSKIIGHSTRSFVESGAFYVSGEFSGVTPEAQNAKKLAAEGFPWQASIGVRPVETLNIQAGKSQVVNGHDVPGPAEIWTKSEVFETSFVPLGADDSTSIETFGGDHMKTQAKMEWQADPALRAEFFDDFSAYEAYSNAVKVGNVKFVSGAACKTFTREDALAGDHSPAETMTPAQATDATRGTWDSDPEIREEFGDRETYEAFLKAEAGNKFKILNH